MQKMKVDYDTVKEQFKSMITQDEDYLDSPSADSFSDLLTFLKRKYI